MTPARPPRNSVSSRVEAEIERMISARRLRPGDRLPSERALAEKLGASRTALREAIGRLAARGRVEVRKTGLVVAQPDARVWAQETIAAPLAPLLALHQDYGHDVMEIRLALEGTAAAQAALRADAAAKARIRDALGVMNPSEAPDDPAAEARNDAAFHLSIAEASDNAVLYQVMHSLFGLLESSISESRDKLYQEPRMAEALYRQHLALCDAIAAGDPQAARAASDAHLNFVASTIRQIDEDLARKARASAARAAGLTAESSKP
ncbi:FCD domain-containing protein [Paracoccus aminovorans]|uniref:FCD domain-containing protein n=1 Tax=Paracoccus aminovorans TaxID=34004 RepID=UPI000B338F38|nr:FCD domain-containing protein [Paracoccus aminovorans]MDQ7774924.1 FCD domain-containing protein [Paracoccus aminovorans]